MIEANVFRIYVDIDSLLDTRLGTLSLLGTEVVETALKDNKYHERVFDEFPYVKHDTFVQLYKGRDKEVLLNSFITDVPEFIRELVRKAKTKQLENPLIDTASIVINFYPFKLTEKEVKDICQVIKNYIPETDSIDFIDKDPSMLDILQCRDNYSAMIMYDYSDWLKPNEATLIKHKSPNLLIMSPALYREKQPDLEELLECKVSPFIEHEKLMSLFIGLKLLDSKVFSISPTMIQNAFNVEKNKE